MATATGSTSATGYSGSTRDGQIWRGLPWQWSVYRWLAGENLTIENIAEPNQAAIDLVQFIIALQQIDTTGGPPPGSRGKPLAARDSSTHERPLPLCKICSTLRP